MESKYAQLYDALVEAVSRGIDTAPALAVELGVSSQQASSRLLECRRRGWVDDTGERVVKYDDRGHACNGGAKRYRLGDSPAVAKMIARAEARRLGRDV